MIPGDDPPLEVEQLGVCDELTPNGGEDDGRCELAVYSFPHYALQTHRGGHETETNERDGVVPGRVRSAGSYASLTRFPDRDGGGHGE